MSKPVAIVKIVDEETGEVLRDSTMVPLYLTNPYDNWSKKYLAKIHYAELKGGTECANCKKVFPDDDQQQNIVCLACKDNSKGGTE